MVDPTPLPTPAELARQEVSAMVDELVKLRDEGRLQAIIIAPVLKDGKIDLWYSRDLWLRDAAAIAIRLHTDVGHWSL